MTGTFILTETNTYRVRAETAEQAEALWLEKGEDADEVEWLGVTHREMEPT